MGRIPNGIMGDMIGTVGNVSGYVRFGTNFVRIKRRKSSRPMSLKRLAQQQKIKVCNDFTRPFSGQNFFNKTFPAHGAKGSGYNRATSTLMNQAVTGIYPDITLAYPLVLISKGALPSPVNASAVVNDDGNILFNWEDNTGTGTARANDKVILVAYFTGLQQIAYSFDGGTRMEEHSILQTKFRTGQVAETWMGFISNDEDDAANSVYTGRLQL
jgi:Family of unknown function (DUF6266)